MGKKILNVQILDTHLTILTVTETTECYFYWQKLPKIPA